MGRLAGPYADILLGGANNIFWEEPPQSSDTFFSP